MSTFRALVLHEEGGKVVPRLESLDESRLPPGEVTVRVEYSTLNYKDGMILQGQGRLVRQYPHVPGIDFAGTVEESSIARVQARRSGDPDRLAGRRIALGRLCRAGARQGRLAGASARGSQRQAGDGDRHRRVHRDAGGASRSNATASSRMLGEVLVTGASGGVGGVAVSLLAALGYRVVASTGRPELRDYLESLGAAELIDRAALAAKPTRPLDRERWAGAIDAVGGNTLATILTQLKYRAGVAACGLAGGSDLPASVIPFLLRGVSLLGIDSVMCPQRRARRGLEPARARPAARPARPDDRNRAARRCAFSRAAHPERRGARPRRRRGCRFVRMLIEGKYRDDSDRPGVSQESRCGCERCGRTRYKSATSRRQREG